MDTAPVPPPVPAPDAHTWEMLCHLSVFCGFIVPFGNLIAPLLIWQLKKNAVPGVIPQGKQSLNFQLSCLIYTVIAAFLAVLGPGFPLIAAVAIFNVVCVIVATIKVNQGKPWSYPLALPLLK